ncbi:MAG: hypothetical protein WBX18_03215, partial [Terracidiphilus sp.]
VKAAEPAKPDSMHDAAGEGGARPAADDRAQNAARDDEPAGSIAPRPPAKVSAASRLMRGRVEENPKPELQAQTEPLFPKRLSAEKTEDESASIMGRLAAERRERPPGSGEREALRRLKDGNEAGRSEIARSDGRPPVGAALPAATYLAPPRAPQPMAQQNASAARLAGGESMRHAAEAAREPDEITIHIGRVEVAAVSQPAVRAAAPARKSVNLTEYLRRGNGRAR